MELKYHFVKMFYKYCYLNFTPILIELQIRKEPKIIIY